jgi:hypothetical protein
MSLASSCNRWPPLRAPPSSRRRSRPKVSVLPTFCALAKFVGICSQLDPYFLLLGMRTALGTSATQAQALQAAYNSSQ